jgi:hypothetical protein
MTTHQPPPPPSKPVVPPAPRPATAEQARRREWAAALRWFGQRNRRVENWMSAEQHLATRIESGALTPWADQPEPDEPVDDVLAAFERGPHGVTAPPPPRVEASGVKLDEPPGRRTATTACPNCRGTGAAAHPLVPSTICEDCKGTGVGSPPEAATGGTGPILGRALLDVDGDVWQDRGNGLWQGVGVESYMPEAELKSDHGPVREVLLVPPEAAQVLEALRAWLGSISATETAEEADLVLAMRALDPAAWHWAEAEPTLEPDPLPAGGPGWDRYAVERIISRVEHCVQVEKMALFSMADAAQLRAVVTDRDGLRRLADGLWRQVDEVAAERDAARRELAEVTARLRTALDAGQDVPDADLVPLAGTHREALAGAGRANQEQTAEVERLRERVDIAVDAGAELLAAEQDVVERLRAELATTRGAAAAAGAGWDREATELVHTREELVEARRIAVATREANHQLGAEHAELVAELDQTRTAALAWQRRADDAAADHEEARLAAELWERAAGDMEARDRHAAADALEEAARYVREVFADSIDPEVGRVLEALAYTTRAGTRVPGTPKPDGGEGPERG